MTTSDDSLPTAPTRDEVTAANRAAWDASAAYHRGGDYWQRLLAGFATPGFSVLDQVERDALGRIGIAGKAVAQLCCNNGRELLSLKNLGAGRCVGFDQAEQFIVQGRELMAAGGIDAELVATDVYSIDSSYDGQFDLVLITIGALGWMPDLPAFFAIVARLLKPGGDLFIHEQHPIVDVFDPQSPTSFEPTWPYFSPRPHVSDQPIVYFGEDTAPASTSYWYTHPLSAIFRACLANGLAIRDFAEYPHNISSVAWDVYEARGMLPLSYTLTARKE